MPIAKNKHSLLLWLAAPSPCSQLERGLHAAETERAVLPPAAVVHLGFAFAISYTVVSREGFESLSVAVTMISLQGCVNSITEISSL